MRATITRCRTVNIMSRNASRMTVWAAGVHICLRLTIAGDQALVDFHGTDAQVQSAINVPVNLTKACVCWRSVHAAEDAPPTLA